MRHFEQTIQRFGSANWCSTAFGEQSHKDMKAQAAFTNGREEHMDLQVICILSAGSLPELHSAVT